MRVALLSSNKSGYQCLHEAIVPTKEVNLVGILSTPECIEISYADDPVKISTYHDFTDDAEKLGCCFGLFQGNRGSDEYLRYFRDWEPDLLIALGWYYLVPKAVRSYVSHGCIGIHCSLLPKYRGGAPIPWAIIEGEKETGVTLFYFDEGVDTGDIIAQKSFPIAYEDTVATLYEKATQASIEILRESLPAIVRDEIEPRPQPTDAGTTYPQRSPADGEINWSWGGERVRNFVRAQTHPYPGAFTWLDGCRIRIWQLEVLNRSKPSLPAGTLTDVAPDGSRFVVVCGDGSQVRIEDAEADSEVITLEGLVSEQVLVEGVQFGLEQGGTEPAE